MICPKCGALNDDATQFCPSCGTPNNARPPNTGGSPQQYAPLPTSPGAMAQPRPGTSKNIKLIVGVVVLVIIIIIASIAVTSLTNNNKPAPTPPTGLKATSGNGLVSLSWSAPIDNGVAITGYKIYRSTVPGASAYLTTVTTTFYNDSGLSNGQTYKYMVSAVNANGDVSQTANVTIVMSAQNDLLNTIESRGQLIVGTEVPYAPFEYYNASTAKYEGIDMEIAQKIADALHVTLVIKPMDFAALFGAVQNGQIDMAISAITITTYREQTNNFTIPYYTANQAVLEKNTSSYSTIDSLNGTKVVTQQGTSGSAWVQTNLVDTGRISASNHVDLPDAAAAATGVQDGIYNEFIVDAPVAYGYAADLTTGLSVGFLISTNEHYGICIQQNQQNFRNAVDNVIQGMIDDGSMHALLLKYYVIGA